ncbi:MAG: ABC transporter transmembrane domain-containing protein [Bacteroidetes bacterium]|nr:ABC transporter transmembrane domain-containing protein [Bacteroidota bacterium]
MSKPVENSKRKLISRKEIVEALRIYRFILPYKWQFIIGMICLVVSTGVVSFIPGGFGKLIDAASPAKEVISKVAAVVKTTSPSEEKLAKISSLVSHFSSEISPEKLKEIGVILGIVLLIQAVLSFFRIYLFEYVAQHAMSSIRRALYEKIITLPIQFFEENRVGNLTSRISSDVTQLQDALTNQLAFFVRQLVLPIVCIPFIFAISVKLTLIILALLPVLVIAAVIFGKFIRNISRKAQDELAESNTIVEETFQAADVVKAFTNEAYETRRYSKISISVANIGMYAAKYRAAFVSFIIFAMFGAIVFIVYAGLNEVAKGSMTMGELIQFFLLTLFIGSSLAGLSESYSVLQKTIGASERINEILGETSEIETSDEHLFSPVKGDVEFKGVHFAYPSRKDTKLFHDLSFLVNAGQKIALVGPSGSGKSTIIKLLSGLYPFEQGDIFIDGKSIRDYNVTALRKNFGTVPQDTILFGGTIRENIAYGKTNATEEEIITAARKANAFSFIDSFPEKFDTVVGERGVKISGGQKQRIAIARAILRDPKILILDEATSALDSESEKLVKEALDELMKNRTTFIIAHRLSTIREADVILVISKGKIVEQGTHIELSKLQDGLYSNLLKLQYDLE